MCSHQDNSILLCIPGSHVKALKLNPLLSLQDYKDARERKEKNKALIMQMHPSAFASSAGSHYASTGRGSGFI